MTNTNNAVQPNQADREPGIPKMARARAVAEKLGLHPRTVTRWADEGRIHRYKLNGRICLFDEAEIASLIQGARV